MFEQLLNYYLIRIHGRKKCKMYLCSWKSVYIYPCSSKYFISSIQYCFEKKVCNPELWIEAPCMYTTAAMNHSWNEEKSGKSARLFNDRCCLHSKITSSQLRSTCRRVTQQNILNLNYYFYKYISVCLSDVCL